MDSKMTVFYRKSTGDLTDIAQGVQSMDMYGSLKADYELIYDFMVVDFDEYVMKNSNLFTVSEGTIKLKNAEELQKYL